MEETSHTDIEQSSEIDSKKNATRLIILGILVALIAIAAAVLGYHYFYTKPLLEENEELKELAELEKQEMESHEGSLC